MSRTVQQVLYRAAQSRWLAAAVLENDGLARRARRAADRYLGGETLEEALAVICRLHAHGLHASIDYFGEAVTDHTVVEHVVEEYLRINRELARFDQPVNVWVDLSNFGLDISDELCAGALRQVVETLPDRARLQIRAHDSSRMDRILRLSIDLATTGARVMPTLPANLRRTDTDLQRVLDARAPVLLVKGASLEPPRFARRWGEETDLAFLRLALGLHAGGAEFAIGTHDPVLREAILASVGNVPLEMLLGVREADALELARTGQHVRVYVPYGSDWLRYWLRRLAATVA